MIRLKITIYPPTELKGDLAALADLCKRPMLHLARPLSRAFARIMVRTWSRRVDPRRNDKPWAPLYTGEPSRLIQTGAMLASARAPHAWKAISANTLRFTLPGKVDYGWYHQTGTQNMPRRGWLPSDRDILRDFKKEFERRMPR